MNEFIVWDKENYIGEDNRFHQLETLLDKGLYVCFEKDNGLVILDYDREDYSPKILSIETFNYIGIKDINNNKIYADCSIVEFDFINIVKEKVKRIGYFSYCKEELQYKFYQYFEQRNKFIPTYLNPKDERYSNGFEIIDPIQENKLGLIK